MPFEFNKEIIKVKNARVHNLKNVSVNIPKNKLTVVTGLSGSGKSSLVFDTIYVEGRRRYIDSLSSYARQFLGMQDKPDVDSIEGLSPTIAINQRSISKNPRSTVGTVTEIYDYMRVLWASIGIPYCPNDNKPVKKQTTDEIIDKILNIEKNKKFLILAPIIRGKKGEYRGTLEKIKKEGYVRVRIDSVIYDIEEALNINIEKNKKHFLEIVIDRLILEENINKEEEKEEKERIRNSVETALELGDGVIIINFSEENKDIFFSKNFACPECDFNFSEITARSFSFNNPFGACPKCNGLGYLQEIDKDLIIPNKKLSILEGAIIPWQKIISGEGWYYNLLQAFAKEEKINLNIPVSKLSEKDLDKILYGVKDKLYKVNGYHTSFEGVISNMERRYKETSSEYSRKDIEKYMRIDTCPLCNGKKLKKESLSVLLNSRNIIEVTEMNTKKAILFFEELKNKLNKTETKIAEKLISEILDRLNFLNNVGLDYMTLDRNAVTLSGGEIQRIRLATQIGSKLTGVIYVLDEPTIGLHQKDNDRLIKSLIDLRDIGNTVIVVEHDEDVIRAGDYFIDIGPKAGKNGGYLMYEGDFKNLEKCKDSLTSDYLFNRKSIEIPKKRRGKSNKFIEIIGAEEHNLKNIDVKIPLEQFVCFTGVSGSGKSTVMIDILAKSLLKKFYRAKATPGRHKEINGVENIDKIINIDQSPIGRTPRSNPATYTGIFSNIRDIFASTKESKIKGYKTGRFSFNVNGGRCEKCKGDGYLKIEMQFLPDVYIECDKCKGKRYNDATLEVHYKNKNIADVLDMTIEEAYLFFKELAPIERKLKILKEVGLGYIKLGQPATTLSGGEAQRIKLATELSKKSTTKTLYLLDEPTTGLHFEDINKLLKILHKLVDKGNSVIVIEHNLDVIKTADWVIDLGPEGGDLGGYIVAEGTPEKIIKNIKSYTGSYLSKII
ncbi:excinuclease ABC subunit UvrA [Patescibacteria group bacterium]|nr:excinuclease ABC subunit UvrA [Patescibacteria group bacterium]